MAEKLKFVQWASLTFQERFKDLNYRDKRGMLEGRLRCINSRRGSRIELNIASARQHHTLIKDKSPKSKIISILTRLINKRLHLKMFSSGLILGGHECLCGTSQKCHLTYVILFTVNYSPFAHGDVSIKFNGNNDNIVLE